MKVRMSIANSGICLIPETKFECDLLRMEFKNKKLVIEFDTYVDGFECLTIKIGENIPINYPCNFSGDPEPSPPSPPKIRMIKEGSEKPGKERSSRKKDKEY
jgi:hypothetical protein